MQPIIGITLGEPAGIGPDIALKLAMTHQFNEIVILVTDANLIRQRAAALKFNVDIICLTEHELESVTSSKLGQVYVLHIPLPIHHQTLAGTPDIVTASWVLQTISKATQLCADNILQALVTGPVQKSIINQAGIVFTGHTEFIAQCLSRHFKKDYRPLMMLTSGKMLLTPLRVALVTTHHALSLIPALITPERVSEKIHTFYRELQLKYGIASPKIYVTGLNPHAGESGHLGLEDEQVIKPAIEKNQSLGRNIVGPLPADTLFTPRYLQDADGVLAMYHDQGLPVLKYASFGGGINVTLGIPIIRTSVDHGTALDLAGTGKADPSSLKAAIDETLFILRRAQL
mgnify:FL=1